MKKYSHFINKIKRGMTLLELVIAMSLTSIVLAGAGTVLFFTSRLSSKNIKSDVALNNAKTLATAIDVTIKTSDDGCFKLSTNETQTNLGKNGSALLFTVNQDEDYGFDGKNFGIMENGVVDEKTAKFSAEIPMYVNISLNGNTAEFSIKYGDSYQYTLSLIEGYGNV